MKLKKFFQGIQRSLDQILGRNKPDRTYFWLPFTLSKNCYTLHSVFKLNLFKNCIKQLEINLQLQPLSLMYPNPFVWPYKQVINNTHSLICRLHVFKLAKNVCYFQYILCSLNKPKCTNKQVHQFAVMYSNAFCVPLYTDH